MLLQWQQRFPFIAGREALRWRDGFLSFVLWWFSRLFLFVVWWWWWWWWVSWDGDINRHEVDVDDDKWGWADDDVVKANDVGVGAYPVGDIFDNDDEYDEIDADDELRDVFVDDGFEYDDDDKIEWDEESADILSSLSPLSVDVFLWSSTLPVPVNILHVMFLIYYIVCVLIYRFSLNEHV